MAGSLSHIVGKDGKFTMEHIENQGDAHEALEECFSFIYYLSGGDITLINAMAERLHFPKIKIAMKLDEPLDIPRPPQEAADEDIFGRPMIGARVIFQHPSTNLPHAAIISNVGSYKFVDKFVDLHVFMASSDRPVMYVRNVIHSQQAEPGTWHWPPRRVGRMNAEAINDILMNRPGASGSSLWSCKTPVEILQDFQEMLAWFKAQKEITPPYPVWFDKLQGEILRKPISVTGEITLTEWILQNGMWEIWINFVD